jgi:hypothetical protein
MIETGGINEGFDRVPYHTGMAGTKKYRSAYPAERQTIRAMIKRTTGFFVTMISPVPPVRAL